MYTGDGAATYIHKQAIHAEIKKCSSEPNLMRVKFGIEFTFKIGSSHIR